mgnify:CR=1 FL=1
MMRKLEKEKPCELCGAAMLRKNYRGRLEDLSAFQRRRFCSLRCANMRGDLTKHGYSWRARKFLKEKCEACGAARLLNAHHIDQDLRNNSSENIQTLCKHCHDFWHSTAKRLGKTVAGKMPCLV